MCFEKNPFDVFDFWSFRANEAREQAYLCIIQAIYNSLFVPTCIFTEVKLVFGVLLTPFWESKTSKIQGKEFSNFFSNHFSPKSNWHILHE